MGRKGICPALARGMDSPLTNQINQISLAVFSRLNWKISSSTVEYFEFSISAAVRHGGGASLPIIMIRSPSPS